MKKEIIYPFFLECLEFTTENFWKNIFEDLAYGKPPYGTFISKDFLCCGYKNKEFTYKIEKKEGIILYNDIYNLLTQKIGILSTKEKNKKKMDFVKLENDIKNSRKTWADIKKKNVKDFLIELYVINMKDKYNLTIVQARCILTIIFIATVFKSIVNKDIVYENGEITKINGFKYNNNTFEFNRDLYNISDVTTLTPEIILEKKYIIENWPKYQLLLKRGITHVT